MRHRPRAPGLSSAFLSCGLALALCLGSTVWAGSPVGDVVGKVSVGYQGWFACFGDGSPNNNSTHWANDWSQPISPSNFHVKTFPDMREYATVYPTEFPAFGNGQAATLFSSYDQQTVNTHFRWMAENGIDTAALQRFGGGNTDAVALKVRAAAETYGRKFYLMYDFNGFSTPAAVEADWLGKGKAFTASPAYARQNGKPVVCMWGIGMSYMTTAQHLEIIHWFQETQGCYVIGGVQREWRADSANVDVYLALDMISPWMIGFIGSVADADGAWRNLWVPDQAYCNAHGIDYQPCVIPGDVSVPGQRTHGNLQWEMFYNARRVGAQGVYISMFDEFDEGNQITKTAEDASMVPTGSNLPTLDEDGTACSSDYYLRLTGDGGRMFRGATPLTATRPTQPTLPVIAPAAPRNLTATGGVAQVTLGWQALPAAAEVSGYTVRRALASSGPYTVIAANVGHTGYTDTGLVNGTTYYYVVSAANSLGTSSDSPPASATPILTYAVNSGGGAAGTFTADAGFSGGSTASTETPVDTSAVTAPAPQSVYQSERYDDFSYTFGSLTPGTTYRVRLHFAEIYYTSTGIRVFNVFINNTRVLSNFDIYAAAGGGYRAIVREFTATASASGQIVIRYANIAGKDLAKSSGIEILPTTVTPPPATPASPTAIAISEREVHLDWPVSTGATSYNVRRGTTDGGPYTTIATGLTEADYWDPALAPGTAYYYIVSAVNPTGESPASPQATVTTQPLPIPAVPYGLNLKPGDAQLSLNWTGVNWATGYKLQRSTTRGGPYTVVATTDAATVSYTDSGRTNGTTYYYVVTGTNVTGESAASSEIAGTPGGLDQSAWVASASASEGSSPAANALDGNSGSRWTTGVSQASGQWFQVDMGAINTVSGLVLDAADSTGDYPRGYQVTLSTDGVHWSSPVATGTGTTARTTITFTAQPARYIRVTLTRRASGIWWSIAEFQALGRAGVKPSTPTGLGAIAGDGQTTLTWSSAAYADGYNVKQSTTSGGPYTTIATNLPALTDTLSGLTNGTKYYYVVSGLNSTGESANSAEVSARPVSLTPPELTLAVGTDGVQATWPADHTGWRLEETYTLDGGWFTIPGSADTNQQVIPSDPAHPDQAFFRLVYP